MIEVNVLLFFLFIYLLGSAIILKCLENKKTMKYLYSPSFQIHKLFAERATWIFKPKNNPNLGN